MTENEARRNAAVAVGVGVLTLTLTLWLGLDGSGWALVFLAATILALVAAIYFIRQYSTLRAGRWQQELGATEQELDRLFSEAQGDKREQS